jgi:hypothetical protein
VASKIPLQRPPSARKVFQFGAAIKKPLFKVSILQESRSIDQEGVVSLPVFFKVPDAT